MPQELKFKSVVDNAPFAAGLARLEKMGAAAAANLDKVMGTKLASIAGKLSSPQQAAITAATAGIKASSMVLQNIGAGVAHIFDAGKAIQLLSRETGGGVAGLVILQDKFRKAGLEGDRVATSIFRLQKSIAGVEDDENKGGAKALENLGLNLAQLRKAAPDQQLLAVGRAISTIQDPAQRTATAMQIFGKSGAELGAVFNGPDFNRISPVLQAKADLLARSSESFERASRGIQRVEGAIQTSVNTFYGGVAEGVVSGLQPLLNDVKSTDLTAIGQGFGKALGDGATAVHKMLEELKASGLVELGQKVAVGISKSVQFAGDAAKLAGMTTKPGTQGGAVLAAGEWVAGNFADQISDKLESVHVLANIGDNTAAKLKRDSDARYADLHNNPSDPGTASTDRRPESRATNNRKPSLPAGDHFDALAQTVRTRLMRIARPVSAPGGMPTEPELYDQEYRGRQVAQAVAAQTQTSSGAVPDRAAVTAGDQTHLVRMALANGGMNTRGMSVEDIGKLAASHVYTGGGSVDANGNANDPYTMRVDGERVARQVANHTVGRGTALDFDPSKQPGWTGARDAFDGFSKRDWANYRGTSGNGYGGHTGLTSGGLGGGAYGRTGNVMTQISGRVHSAKDPAEATAKNTAAMLVNLQALVDGLTKGGGGGGGGVSPTR